MRPKRTSSMATPGAVAAGHHVVEAASASRSRVPRLRPVATVTVPAKRRRLLLGDSEGSRSAAATADFFDGLPDDIVLCILRRLSSTASQPSDLLGVQMACKRLRSLALQPMVLARASLKSLAVPASSWSEAVHSFLKRCAEAGNLDACYMLGMIRFYCLGNRPGGMSLLARAAMRQHAGSLYSLAVIQFNGSGSLLKSSKNLRAGVVLCARAVTLGHVDALRELGHCLQDGYGVRRDVARGRRFLVQANAREIAIALRGIPNGFARLLAARKQHQEQNPSDAPNPRPLLSDIPALQPHPANRFLSDWFALSGTLGGSEDLRMCSHAACGRPETRRHEFRRCSVCGKANYCSRACQALDWRFRHKAECVPMPRWVPVQLQPPADGGAGAAEAAAAAANGRGYAAAG